MVCLPSYLFPQFELDEFKIKPQIGLWFGPVLPFPGSKLSERLLTSLGGGIFFRINLPSDNFKTEISTSLNYYTSDSTESLISVPNYAAVSYSLPIDSPLLFQLKLGMGVNYMRNSPEKNENSLPLFFSGFEMSFPAGKVVNIGIRVDYYFVIESFVKKPKENPDFQIYNGHFINLGLMLNFNLNP